jgi:hypothetical protein
MYILAFMIILHLETYMLTCMLIVYVVYEWFDYETVCVVLIRNGGCMILLEGPRMAYVYR